MSTNYTVTAEREGKWWVFTVPALDIGGQARSLAEVDAEAQGIVSAWLDVRLEDVATTTSVVGYDHELDAWKVADEADRAAREAAMAAKTRRQAVVANLRQAGLTGADIARIVGVTKQRVSQLEKAT